MLCKNAKTDICKTVSSIFHGAGLASEMFRHQPQIVTKRFIALFEVVSNFAAFKRCSRSVRNPSPSHPLPFLQLTDLAVQNIGLRHAAGLLKRPVLADFLARTGVGRTIGRKILTLLFALAVTVGAAASAFGQMTLTGAGGTKPKAVVGCSDTNSTAWINARRTRSAATAFGFSSFDQSDNFHAVVKFMVAVRFEDRALCR